MTILRGELAKLAKRLTAEPVADAPEVELTVAPTTAADAAAVLRVAAERGMRVLFWGGGTHQGYGHQVEPDVVMTTSALDDVVDWQPDDLTIVVQPGMPVAELQAQLEQRGQTAVLPERPDRATVGGVVASGVSGWRRLRYGPTRDRVLEVELATGDGRLVRGGGRLVKNVTGYDLPRLATGSLGSLGLITAVCLKLWPLTAQRATLEVGDPQVAARSAYRPHAVIETNDYSAVYLAGTEEEIAAQAELIGGSLVPGHRWPEPLPGRVEMAARIPAQSLPEVVEQIRSAGWRFQAAHGVGEIRFVSDGSDRTALTELRKLAESTGGALVTVRAPRDFGFDPWGRVPDSLDLQRRVKAAFDPAGVANPGILPGGI